MKKIAVLATLLVGFTFMFFSCSTTDVTPEDDIAATMDFMGFASASGDSSRFGKGPRNVTEIAVAELPAAVTTYINTTYAGATIDKAGKLTDGSFVVKITKKDGTSAGLLFDAAGKFVSEKQPKKPHTHVAATELPKEITDYITATYAGSTIKMAAKFTDGTGYHVAVQKADNTMVGLAFDGAGKFVSELAMKARGNGKKKGHGK